MTNEVKFWEKEFGDDYFKRNEITENVINARTILWQYILSNITMPMGQDYNFLEIGAGNGANLITLSKLYSERCASPMETSFLYGLEPNPKACKELSKIPYVTTINSDILSYHSDTKFDIVFTSGVLIHINPSDLKQAITNIYKLSKKWIVCIEYFNPTLVSVPYHGKEALWKQDFGELYLNTFSGKLRVQSCCFFWKRITGLDNVTAWIFEKVH